MTADEEGASPHLSADTFDPVPPPLQPAPASRSRTMPIPDGSMPGGRDLPAARIRRLPAGILPRISFHASSLSVPADARLALARGERDHGPRSTGRKAHLDPAIQVSLSAPESNAPCTGPSAGQGPRNVRMLGSDNTRSRDRGRLFRFVQTQKSPGAYQGSATRDSSLPDQDGETAVGGLHAYPYHPPDQSEDRFAHDPADLPQPGPLFAAGRPARRRRLDSRRSLRGGADRREHRDHRLRPQGRPRRHLRHDELRQPRL